MKLFALTMLALVLSGCAGLNVSWIATATYNTPSSISVDKK